MMHSLKGFVLRDTKNESGHNGSSHLEGVYKVYNEGMFDVFQNVPFCLGVSRVLLIPYDGGLFQHLHGVDLVLVLARQLAHLENFAVTPFAENLPQLEIWNQRKIFD